MSTSANDAIPSFIHVEQKQQKHHHRPQSLGQALITTLSSGGFSSQETPSSVEQTTAIFLRRFSISRNYRHHPQAANKRQGRGAGGHSPAASRVRGKHGLVKSLNRYSSGHCHSSHYSNDSKCTGGGLSSKETRLSHLKKYMQSRRMRLRQRQQQRRNHPLDTSDMSMDEADIIDEDDGDDVFTIDQEQYRRNMWELEQRLWERTRSAARARSHLLMERRISAGDRVDHVQRVVQRQRKEQEKRQHRARDELEQKMMRAMARRNAYLEAAIENDPSRRFRRKNTTTTATTVALTSAPRSAKPTTHPLRVVPAATGSTMEQSIRNLDADGQRYGPTRAKNSPANMTKTTKEKHLTNMTSTTTMSPSSTAVTMKKTSASASVTGVIQEDSTMNMVQDQGHEVSAGSNKKAMWAQRRICQQFIQKASHEYMKAMGGQHKRVLTLGFEELAQLLHSNKVLIQATLRLLKYASQLVQLDEQEAANAGAFPREEPKGVPKNPARVFLSMYMVIAHPGQIRSPTEPASIDASADQGNDEAFESLVESARALLEALDTWLSANLKADTTDALTQGQVQQHHSSDDPSGQMAGPTPTALDRHDPALVKNFDEAWTSYYNFFQAWKDKDATRLLQTLLDHARQIEALWRTVRSDPSAGVEWEPRIEEQRRDLRAKAGQLAGSEGAAGLDAVFADFVHATTTGSLSTTAATGLSSVTMDEHAPPPTFALVTNVTSTSTATDASIVSVAPKKRQRAPSASYNQIDVAHADVESSGDHRTTDSTQSIEAYITKDGTAGASTTTDQEESRKIKKPTKSKNQELKSKAPDASQVLEDAPAGVVKPAKWTNLQLIHELALDAGFKIEPRRPPGSGAARDGQDESSSGDDIATAASTAGQESLEARIRAMATKAYFDRIREDAEQGLLGKWIPSLLTTIREQLLDMIPAGSAMAAQVSEGFDLEFVQQQVERNVYDIKEALTGVLKIMSKLCAPVRDSKIRQIQDDLSLVSQNPFQQDATTTAESSSSSTTPGPSRYLATAGAPKDLVSVLQDILGLLEIMLLDMANFRLTVARPKLEKQAIPYEQNAFAESLESGEVSLDSTMTWLRESGAKLLNGGAPSVSTTTVTTNDESSTHPGHHRRVHYEILVHAILDLLFSSKHFNVGSDREQFPVTLALDRERMTRYQNEIQGLALVAVIMNISLNVAPSLKEEEQIELKGTLLKLMERPNTSKETLAEAVIEAKERALLMAARPSLTTSTGLTSLASESGAGSPAHGSSRHSSPAPSSTAKLLLSDEQKSYVSNTISRAISFDSTLFTVLSQRIRKVLETYILSTTLVSGTGHSGHMPDPASLNKMGLGSLTTEIETLAGQIRLLTKYNAQVYRMWYDPMLRKVVAPAAASD